MPLPTRPDLSKIRAQSPTARDLVPQSTAAMRSNACSKSRQHADGLRSHPVAPPCDPLSSQITSMEDNCQPPLQRPIATAPTGTHDQPLIVDSQTYVPRSTEISAPSTPTTPNYPLQPAPPSQPPTCWSAPRTSFPPPTLWHYLPRSHPYVLSRPKMYEVQEEVGDVDGSGGDGGGGNYVYVPGIGHCRVDGDGDEEMGGTGT